ncbi:BON domain-containing protein [Variovorax rhizosphaerae]|uniref:BON domain-containing protein n=1 Tax=Variovorax rhizosphaerae TaxID=1836200 RepID=A0ABU8WI47_9BURK
MNISNQQKVRTRTVLAMLVAGCALALGGCDNKAPKTTVGEKVDSAVASTKDAAADAKAKTESAAASAGASMKEGAADATQAAKNAGSTVAAKVDDAAITASVSAGLAKDPDLSAIKINVDTKGGMVTLNGPAPSAAAKARAEAIAKGVEGVSSVDNKLEVKM